MSGCAAPAIVVHRDIGSRNLGSASGLHWPPRSRIEDLGRVAEWFKAPVLKTGEGASLPWVRIPPRPRLSFAPVRGDPVRASNPPTNLHRRPLARCVAVRNRSRQSGETLVGFLVGLAEG